MGDREFLKKNSATCWRHCPGVSGEGLVKPLLSLMGKAGQAETFSSFNMRIRAPMWTKSSRFSSHTSL